MNKNQLIIEDYDIFDTELSVYFSVNQELDVREGRIDLDEFDVWLNRNGLYEMSRDCWDYAQESHYTEDWEIGFGEYLSDYICTNDVRDFVIDYYENKTLPDFVEE